MSSNAHYNDLKSMGSNFQMFSSVRVPSGGTQVNSDTHPPAIYHTKCITVSNPSSSSIIYDLNCKLRRLISLRDDVCIHEVKVKKWVCLVYHVIFSLTSPSLLMAEIPKYQFKSVQLLKDQSLGIGSYGAVCKAKCDDLLCAAKIIHPTLLDLTTLQQVAPQREHRLPIRRFEQECEFMSAIRHPNIVQYLGMFRDTDTVTCLPVLLMELMDDSLTHFLESSTQPIPYHIQINICHDVSLALSFLHSNKIIHRDLSSNNVLLRGNILAKVTDFGMARLSDINPQATRFTSTMCPGTDVYMPPEAVQDKPVYTEKIDCFSFGVIIVQTLTRQFPKPGDRLERVELNHPRIHTKSVLVEVPEVECRQKHIRQIDPNHSLLPVALNCLKDKDSERPSAHQLCERVADLKGTPKYRDSARAVRDEVIQSQAICMERIIISSKEEEIQRLRQQLQEKDQQLEERERQLNQQIRLQQERETIASQQTTGGESETTTARKRPSQQSTGGESETTTARKRPNQQITGGESETTTPRKRLEATFKRASLVDEPSDCVWGQIADLPVKESTCESFRGQLLAIGGRLDSLGATTAVYMYHSSTDSWEIVSHMKTGRIRCFAAVLPNSKLIVVAGGILSDTVEIASIKA